MDINELDRIEQNLRLALSVRSDNHNRVSACIAEVRAARAQPIMWAEESEDDRVFSRRLYRDIDPVRADAWQDYKAA